MTRILQPGLLVLHGNRTELLAEALFDWTRSHPLGALEEEVFLVQNHGIAEWLKMQLAARQGVCAATRIELPARFLWRAYRQVLGRASVPAQSPLDKSPLAWRLMRRLPGLLGDPVYAPLARFLRPGDDAERRLQLCRRLADLYDQYQLYRGDWLDAWAAGDDVLRSPAARRSRCRPSSAGRRRCGASCSPGSTSASAPACGRWCSSASWPRWRRPTRRPRRCRAAWSSSAPATCRCRRCRPSPRWRSAARC